MHHTFWNQGGESRLAAIMRRPATIMAALMAVIVVVLSMLTATPIALAEPESATPTTTAAVPAAGETTTDGDNTDGGNTTPSPTNTPAPTPDTAPIFIKKAISGERPPGLNDNTELTVEYQCDKDSADGTVGANKRTEVKLKASGFPVTGPNFPVGTKCKVVTEFLEAPTFTDYTFTPRFGEEITVSKDEAPSTIVVTNTFYYHGPTGSLLIKKDVQGLHDLSLIGDVIEGGYVCVPAGQSPELATWRSVDVPTSGAVKEITGIPVGHDCHVVEYAIPTPNGYSIPDGYTLKTAYSPAGAAGGKVTIKEGQGDNGSNLVTITNTYEPEASAPQPVFVKKIVTGEHPAGLNNDTEFTVQYRCDRDSADGTVTANTPTEVKVKANGDPVTGPEFPTGTKCKVVAEKPDEPKFEGYSFTPELGGEITVAGDAAARTMVVTNIFTKNEAGDEAKLSVAKAVSGDAGAEAEGKEFSFEYVCGRETGVLKITGNGIAETETTFPAGTECTVTELGVEEGGTAQIDNHVLAVTPRASQQVVIGQDAGAKFTNTYTVRKGTFGVAKKAHGENGNAAEHEFVFDYT